MVLVSHDRHLLETTVDEFQLVAEGGVRPFDGDLDDYARWLQQSRREAKAPAGDNKAAGKDDAKQRAPNFVRLIDLFNRTSYIVSDSGLWHRSRRYA